MPKFLRLKISFLEIILMEDCGLRSRLFKGVDRCFEAWNLSLLDLSKLAFLERHSTNTFDDDDAAADIHEQSRRAMTMKQ